MLYYETVTPDDDPLLTITEVAKKLRVNDATVRRWIKEGVLEACPLPHTGHRTIYRVRLSTLGDVLKQSQSTLLRLVK